jgi:endonuclease-3 related protein
VREVDNEKSIRAYFHALYSAFGAQHWWPADSRLEVIVGAYLTQNTAWTNVELALANLRDAGRLSLDAIRQIDLQELELLIRPAGFFRQKAQRLKTFVAYLDKNHAGSLEVMFSRPTTELRNELLALNGVGPETADSILLYAGNHEVFVVDAYTRRILSRHGILPTTAVYEEVRLLFEQALTKEFAVHIPTETTLSAAGNKPSAALHLPSTMSEENRSTRAQIMNEMHALIVGVAKKYCQSRRTLCDECPLRTFLEAPITLDPMRRKR